MYNQNVENKIRNWLPLALTITVLCFLLYAVSQQVIRLSANDPQIQLSEEIAYKLKNGQDTSSIISDAIDLSHSIAPFSILYDASGYLLYSTATLDGKPPVLPKGVLEFTKEHGQNRVTWQPQKDIRIASVITYYHGQHTGYVLVGRSLREAERRVDMLARLIAFGWLCSLAITFVVTMLSSRHYKK